MKTFFTFLILLCFVSLPSYAGKTNTLRVIAKEPVTMMDLGIIKLNGYLSRPNLPGLPGATIGATYNARKGSIDIKVSAPVKKASKAQCKKVVQNIKKLFLRTYGKKKTSNIYHYFQHEGTGYSRRINWDDVANHVLITGIVLTKSNYQVSVYCESQLMKESVTY